MPSGTRAKAVRCSLDGDGDGDGGSLLTVAVNGKPVVKHTLFGAVDKVDPEDNDDDDDAMFEWEVVDAPPAHGASRLVCVTVRKKPPVAGMVYWWRKAFQEDTVEVAAGDLVDRKPVTPSGQTMQQVWDAAHEEFKRRVAERVEQGPIEVDCGDDDTDDEAEDEEDDDRVDDAAAAGRARPALRGAPPIPAGAGAGAGAGSSASKDPST